MVMIVERGAYCAIMHKWFYLPILVMMVMILKCIRILNSPKKNTILPTDRLLNIKHAFGNYFP